MYQKIKEEIKDIISIVRECPDTLQTKCFEMLLNNLLNEVKSNNTKTETTKEETSDTYKGEIPTVVGSNGHTDESEISLKDFHVKTRRFIESSGLSCDDINNIYYKEGTKILPLYEELGTNKMNESQIRIALLAAFENSFDNDGEMVFDGEIVRKKCQDLKCYDSSNFAAHFKKSSSLFDDFEKYEKGNEIKLSAEGKKELAKVLLMLSRGEK